MQVFLALVLVLGLVGCGGSNDSVYDPYRRDATGSEAQIIAKTNLLDEKGHVGPAIDPDGGGSPFGILMNLNGYSYTGSFSSCTVTHLSRGLVATNAHCLHSSDQGSKLAIIYYDVRGEKKSTRVERVVYRGEHEKDDFALLAIPSSDAQNWDVASGAVAHGKGDQGRRIRIYSYDPVSSYYDYSRAQFQFSPKTCLAGRETPRLEEVSTDSMGGVRRKEEKFRDLPVALDSNVHLFMESCTADVIKGNSGALIRDLDKNENIGVVHWIIKASPRENLVSLSDPGFIGYEYRGPSGETKSAKSFSSIKFFVGTCFDWVLSQNPGLF